jgi:hypothetical protein
MVIWHDAQVLNELANAPGGIVKTLPPGSLWEYKAHWKEPQYAMVVSHQAKTFDPQAQGAPTWTVKLLFLRDEKVIPWVFRANGLRNKRWTTYLTKRVA